MGAAKATVTVQVRERKGTRSISAGIEIVGARNDRAYELSVDQVIVTFGGSLVALDAIDAGAFTVTVDVSNLGGGSHVVRVVVPLPSGATLVATNPAARRRHGDGHGPPAAATLAPSPSPSPTPAAEPSVAP